MSDAAEDRMARILDTREELSRLLLMSDGTLSPEGAKILAEIDDWIAAGAPPHKDDPHAR